MKKINFVVVFALFAILVLASCNSSETQKANESEIDSTPIIQLDTTATAELSQGDTTSTQIAETKPADQSKPKIEQSKILIYNFHVTNRCVSCIAIEDATTKTLKTYFAKELKEGRINRQIINVDDEANAKIAEKYQAFGSGLFITRSFKGKEETTDLTGDGFKFAKNKEERFIEILKTKITEYLK